MSRDNKTVRVQVNLTPEEARQLDALVAERRGRMSRSAVVCDALDFYFAYRAHNLEQRDYRRAHAEHAEENAPVTAQDAPVSRPPLREV